MLKSQQNYAFGEGETIGDGAGSEGLLVGDGFGSDGFVGDGATDGCGAGSVGFVGDGDSAGLGISIGDAVGAGVGVTVGIICGLTFVFGVGVGDKTELSPLVETVAAKIPDNKNNVVQIAKAVVLNINRTSYWSKIIKAVGCRLLLQCVCRQLCRFKKIIIN